MENTPIDKEQSEKPEDMSAETATATPAEEPPVMQAEANEINKLKDELAGAKDKFIRLYSEFENFRRRTAKEKLEMVQTANEQLLQALLPVADDFDRAEKSFREKNDKDAEGFILIRNKFRKVLESSGVKIMDVKKGSEFNTDLHEAITQIPVEEKNLKGKVVEVVEQGYLLNDKVIRFAKVVVGS
jgi:molecular chaperone GrpE